MSGIATAIGSQKMTKVAIAMLFCSHIYRCISGNPIRKNRIRRPPSNHASCSATENKPRPMPCNIYLII